MPDDNSLNEFLKSFYGEPIFSYTDQDAVADGILIPFVAGEKDTLHRITSNAFNELSEYHREKNYPDYEAKEFYRFFFAELLFTILCALDTSPENTRRVGMNAADTLFIYMVQFADETTIVSIYICRNLLF